MSRIMLVDGMSLLFRGYYATAGYGRIRKTKEGLPTNAVHWLVKYLWHTIQTFQPTHLVCCWDTPAPTFRNKMYSEYKTGRPAPPEALIPQFQLAQNVIESMGILNISYEGYEADDLIGTLAKKYAIDIDVDILSGDHDTLQLIDHRIRVIIMAKGFGRYNVYTKEKFEEEKGFSPEQLIDLKALMGDQSDHYPGVRGIGEKTAQKLIREYGSVDEILKNKEDLSMRIRSNIEKDIDMLLLSRKLARIDCGVPINIHLMESELRFEHSKMKKTFERLEFRSLLDAMMPSS
ncbi:5'-3' exonuclease [Scopulibacillus daqui]|uniref:5'-3' exonuclease n=1 Tax=Scopulibacillus daqui TaxID=1469162 RepID=A0ABS2Q1H2_9BACL|nr:5'-3' exonuclease H3TH domain-containing protein [Scopulibacillus daqui]MBM7645705.1 5'-3' exonuclease [Scopulibacillus daqui]